MADWSPPRPERTVPAWREGDSAAGSALPQGPDRDSGAGAFDPAPALPRTPPRRRRPPFWRRAPRRGVALAIALLAASIALVTGLGATLTPVYGDLAPYRQSGVVEVRRAPVAQGWTTDLARAIVPGAPVRCVSFDSRYSAGPLVVIAGSSEPLGSSARCSSLTTDQVESTIALFDPATGRVRWSKDLRTVFPDVTGAIGLGQSTIVASAGQVVVQVDLGDRYGLASFSIASGSLTGTVEQPPDQIAQSPEFAGSLVLYSGSSSREGSSEWTLADVRHLSRPLWNAILPDSSAPVMTRKAAFASVDGKSVRIDGRTGALTRFGDGHVDLSNPLQDADDLYTTSVLESGTIVTAWDADGRRLWSRSGIGNLSGISRDCVVVSLPGTTKLTCLDRASGRSRWTTDVGSLAFASSFSGQTTDDVPVYRVRENRTEIVVLDGATGHEEYVLRLDPQSRVLAVSRTTGYLQTTSQSGQPGTVTAFDVRSGRLLWRSTTVKGGAVQLWGGHLVSLDPALIARELCGRSRVILGD